MDISMLEHFELWLPVVGYEGLYEVSNCGRVRSLAREVNSRYPGRLRIIPGRVRLLTKNRFGYLIVSLTEKTGRKRHPMVATLVATAFIGPRPPGLQIDHKDGDKQNNGVWNLHYVTPKENRNAGNFAYEPAHGETHSFAKLSDAEVIEIRRLIIEGMSQRAIAKLFNVTQSHISRIKTKNVRRMQ